MMESILRLIYGENLANIIAETIGVGIIGWKLMAVIIIAIAGNWVYYKLFDRPSWVGTIKYLFVGGVTFLICYILVLAENEYQFTSISRVEGISDLFYNILTNYLRIKIYFHIFWLSLLVFMISYAGFSFIFKKFSNNNRYIPHDWVLGGMIIIPILLIVFIYILI